MILHIGQTLTWKRTFLEEDIRLFGRLSGDQGDQHVFPDDKGRLVVQGLLTATLPTKIGGDVSFMARHMAFQFIRPVYAGDTITCEVTILSLLDKDRFIELTSKWYCQNQHGKKVMTGEAAGIINQRHNASE